MATKTFKVSLSLDNPRLIQSGINVRSFDKRSIKIAIELTKNSQVYQIPTGAQIKISLLKLARQEQKIILDLPFTNADSIDWIVPDYLDGYQGEVRVGIYLIVGTENIDVGYFNITSSVSDIDNAAEEFTESVMQGWGQIEADLAEIRATITQVNTLASDFTTDVATKQTDVTSKYNAFDTSVTQAGQTIDDILALKPQFQSVLDETTGKDVISAPEIIVGRGSYATLGERLDSEKADVTAQLAETTTLTQNRISTTKKVRFIAHRGASLAAPENTLKSCELAGLMGFWGTEFDVQITKDGKWVVIHDETLDRTTNGTGNVKDYTLAEIKNLVITAGFNVAYYPNQKVPTLEEYLLTCKKYNVHPYIEIKYTGQTSENYLTLVNVLRDSGFEENCTIIGNDTSVVMIRKHSQLIRCEILTPIDQLWIDRAILYGNCGLDAYHETVTKELVELAHSQGISVNCWSTNSDTRARELIAMGVDFISSDTIAGGI